MEAANQVTAYISKLDQQPIRDHYLFWKILIYIRCKHKIYLDPKGLTRLSLKQIPPLSVIQYYCKLLQTIADSMSPRGNYLLLTQSRLMKCEDEQ